MSRKYTRVVFNPFFIAGILMLITVMITGHRFLLEKMIPRPDIPNHTYYNNYVIFKQSFFHLIAGEDLYKGSPEEYRDYYKYSPAFALLMAPLAVLPDAMGLFIWNALNVLILFIALWRLPLQTDRSRLFVLGFILLELITSIQNAQSNALIAGLIILGFLYLEKHRVLLAALCIVLTIFIKLIGLVALCLFIFYPHKLKSMAFVLGWIMVFLLLPLLVISVPQLLFLYESWYDLLQIDHSASIGLSVAGWLHSWFSVDAKNSVLVIGVIVFCLPLFKISCYDDLKFKLMMLCSALIWMVIFNHKAESPTFIIAVTGIAIWFTLQQRSLLNRILMVSAFFLTVLSPTDLFPKVIRDGYIVPYTLKAVPCILIWFKIIVDLLCSRPEQYSQVDAMQT